ncbi:MAG: hypothetical protein HYU51_14615 [Candidatus Rokubacteria bacterium]|nr:hypothetical protein [Candidatus Rokubacteria bacterium]
MNRHLALPRNLFNRELNRARAEGRDPKFGSPVSVVGLFREENHRRRSGGWGLRGRVYANRA